MKHLTGGVLHSKFWVVDGRHVYVGSANMDWRSLAQVGPKAQGWDEAQVQLLPSPSPRATASEESWYCEKLASRTLGHTPLLSYQQRWDKSELVLHDPALRLWDSV